MTNKEIIKEIEESIRLINQTKTTVNDALCHARTALERQDKLIKEAYDRGLNNAWELARIITAAPCDDGFAEGELLNIFQTPFARHIFKCNTYQEALAKMGAYEKEQERRIKVGDIVTGYNGGEEYVVVATEDEMPNGQPLLRNRSNGKVCFATTCSLVKTGEHIDITIK